MLQHCFRPDSQNGVLNKVDENVMENFDLQSKNTDQEEECNG